MLRAIMAVSADGYVSRGPDDDMSWTGPEDKRLFRTATEGCAIGAGTTTWRLMKDLELPGRKLVRISRAPLRKLENESIRTLGGFAETYPDGWLIGGQTVLLAGIDEGLVDRVLLSIVSAELKSGEPDRVSEKLQALGGEFKYFPVNRRHSIMTWRKSSGS